MSLAYHFVSGNAYFSGGALILAAALASLLPGVLLRVACRTITLLGMILVLLSATPQPPLLRAVWFAVVVAWLVLDALKPAGRPTARRWLSAGVVLLSCGAMLAEVPYRLAPGVPERDYRRLYVIGDSISAGLRREREIVWPQLLRARLAGTEVINLARPGATLSGALHQADRVESDDALVVLEIGGNDLLAGAPASKFSEGLDALLERVRGPGRTIVMLELPLPPLRAGYGRAQRRLAKEYGVILIPKRFFARVLAGPGNTVDGLHLSRQGHERMAETMASLLAPATG